MIWKASAHILFLILILAGCTHTGGSQSLMRTPTSDAVKVQKMEPEARGLYSKAENFFQKGDYPEAAKIYQLIKKQFPGSTAAMVSTYRLGCSEYLMGNFNGAAKEFDLFLSKYPESDLTFDVTYNFAASEYQNKKYEKSNEILSRLTTTDIESQGNKRAAVVYHLMGINAEKVEKPSRAAFAFAKEFEQTTEKKSRTTILSKIEDQLAKVSNKNDIQILLSEINHEAVKEKFMARLSAIAEESRTSSQLEDADALKEDVIANDIPTSGAPMVSGEGWKIGVLLPLSGKLENYGKKALNAILLSSGIYHKSNATLFRIYIEDSAAGPNAIKQAYDKFKNLYRVNAIIGPLQYRDTVAISEQMQQNGGIPTLSLSAKEGISATQSQLYQIGLSPRVQMENLAEYCIKQKQMQRFAILMPNDELGLDMANEFQFSVKQLGATVVATKAYPREETDFLTHVKNLIIEQRPELQKLEPKRLAAFLDNERKTASKGGKVKVSSNTGFDAILLPDSPGKIGAIAASLAYFDLKDVTLLGTSEWNTSDLFLRGGKNLEGALFPAALSASARNVRQRQFIKEYQDNFGSMPDLLAAQGYQAFEILRMAISKAGQESALNSSLSKIKNLETVVGLLSFDNNRVARQKLPIYTILSNGSIVEE